MPTPLEDLDIALIAKFDPFLIANGGPINGVIEQEDFQTIEDVEALVERFSARMPAAFLSIPRSDGDDLAETPATSVRVQEHVNYSFACISDDARDTPTKLAFIRECEDLWNDNLLQQIPGTPTTNWFWGVIDMEVKTPLEGPGFMGWAVSFNVKRMGPCGV